MNKIVLLVCVCTIIGCRTIEVSKIKIGSEISGLTYRLPRTQLLIEIEVKTTSFTKNSCYASTIDKFNHVVPDALQERFKKETALEVANQSSLVVSPLPVTDTSKIFRISTNSRFFQNRTYNLFTDENGFPSQGEFSAEDQTIPLVSQIISSAAGFISPFSKNRTLVTDSCALLLQQYNKLESSRLGILNLTAFNNHPEFTSKDLYEKFLAEIETEKQKLFSQMVYSTNISIHKAVIRFIPLNEDASLLKGIILYAIDKKDPVIYINEELVGEVSSMVSASPGLSVKPKKQAELDSMKSAIPYTIKIIPTGADRNEIKSLTDKPQVSDIRPHENAGGIYYNIPLSCKVYMRKNGKNIYDATIMLPQWGSLGRLSNALSKQVIEFHALYGSLKSLQAESKTIPTDQVKSFSESLAAARDVFYTDPITKMERRIKYLETKESLSSAESAELSNLRKEKELLKEKKEISELEQAIEEVEKQTTDISN